MSFAALGVTGTIAAIGALGAGAKVWQGASQQNKAKKIDRKNPFVTEQANPLYAKNLAIAENASRTGLPQQQYNQAQQNFQRNQTAGLRQIGKMGRGGSVAGLVRAGNDATLGLDIADANARMKNQGVTYGMRNQLAGEQNRVWDWNNRTKYLQGVAKAEALRGAGQQNMMSGFSDLSTLGSYALMGGVGGGVGGGQGSPSMAGAVSQSPNFGQDGNVGQYGTRLRGMQGMGFGGNYNYPTNQSPIRFSPRFIPKGQ